MITVSDGVFIDADKILQTEHGFDTLLWQTVIHLAFIVSAVALAWIDKISAKHPPKAAPVVAEARGPVTNPPKASDDQRETVSVL